MNREKILTILGKVIGRDAQELLQLPGDTDLSDIGLLSLPFIQFIVALEEECNVEILDSDLVLSNFQTIDMLFETLDKYLGDDIAFKKVLICDCDNCLWHGVAGEEDISVDEACITLQRELIRLYENGILLCLCSKNEPSNIANAFARLSMPLKQEHLVMAKISRLDKASHIRQIAAELNLSADSFVFLDDSDYELGLIDTLLPQVTTLKADLEHLTDTLEAIRSCFHLDTSQPDRTRQYREQKEREKTRIKCHTVEEYNASLETIFSCQRAELQQADRIAELSMRTNQCNLSCARYTAHDICRMLADPAYTLLSLCVKDKYGDMGLVGAAVIHAPATIEAFFLSCRAFDRNLEDILMQHIRELFPSGLMGIYRENEKNLRFRDFYPQHGVTLYEG